MTILNPISLTKYIDLILIDDHADKDLKHGVSLDVNTLPIYEFNNFLEKLIQHDPIMDEIIRNRMQELIDRRISIVESKYRYDSGVKAIHDHVNGEIKLISRGAA